MDPLLDAIRCHYVSHYCRRQFPPPIRVVSLAPPGVPNHHDLDALIPDTVTGTISGFDCINTQCKIAEVFLDMCEFLRDYLASSEILDVVRHMTGVPCSYFP